MSISVAKELSSFQDNSPNKSLVKSAGNLRDNIVAGVKTAYRGIFYSSHKAKVSRINMKETHCTSDTVTTNNLPSKKFPQFSGQNSLDTPNAFLSLKPELETKGSAFTRDDSQPTFISSDSLDEIKTVLPSPIGLNCHKSPSSMDKDILVVSNAQKEGLKVSTSGLRCLGKIDNIDEDEISSKYNETFSSNFISGHKPDVTRADDCMSEDSNYSYKTALSDFDSKLCDTIVDNDFCLSSTILEKSDDQMDNQSENVPWIINKFYDQMDIPSDDINVFKNEAEFSVGLELTPGDMLEKFTKCQKRKRDCDSLSSDSKVSRLKFSYELNSEANTHYKSETLNTEVSLHSAHTLNETGLQEDEDISNNSPSEYRSFKGLEISRELQESEHIGSQFGSKTFEVVSNNLELLKNSRFKNILQMDPVRLSVCPKINQDLKLSYNQSDSALKLVKAASSTLNSANQIEHVGNAPKTDIPRIAMKRPASLSPTSMHDEYYKQKQFKRVGIEKQNENSSLTILEGDNDAPKYHFAEPIPVVATSLLSNSCDSDGLICNEADNEVHLKSTHTLPYQWKCHSEGANSVFEKSLSDAQCSSGRIPVSVVQTKENLKVCDPMKIDCGNDKQLERLNEEISLDTDMPEQKSSYPSDRISPPAPKDFTVGNNDFHNLDCNVLMTKEIPRQTIINEEQKSEFLIGEADSEEIGKTRILSSTRESLVKSSKIRMEDTWNVEKGTKMRGTKIVTPLILRRPTRTVHNQSKPKFESNYTPISSGYNKRKHVDEDYDMAVNVSEKVKSHQNFICSSSREVPLTGDGSFFQDKQKFNTSGSHTSPLIKDNVRRVFQVLTPKSLSPASSTSNKLQSIYVNKTEQMFKIGLETALSFTDSSPPGGSSTLTLPEDRNVETYPSEAKSGFFKRSFESDSSDCEDYRAQPVSESENETSKCHSTKTQIRKFDDMAEDQINETVKMSDLRRNPSRKAKVNAIEFIKRKC